MRYNCSLFCSPNYKTSKIDSLCNPYYLCLGYICPHRSMFLVCNFPTDFSDIVGEYVLRVRRLLLQYIRASYDFLLWLSSTFLYKTAQRSYGNRTESLSCGLPTPVRCLYDVSRATLLRFLKNYKSADYYKIVVGTCATKCI